MPKYYPYQICGYYLYFTSSCTVEAFHVHASDKVLSEKGSAKFWVGENGDSRVEKRGRLKEKEIKTIQLFIKENYSDMYSTWTEFGGKPEYYSNI